VSLRLWRAPQPYFKLRFCSLIAFGPDCSHFPSAIPNMRENGAHLVSAVREACRGQADVNVDAMPDTIAVPKVSPPAPLQSLRREARLDQARMAHGPPSGRARLWPRMPVGAPTNGRDSHLGEHSDHCRAQGPSRDSLSQGETTTKDGAGGFPLAPWPKPASDWRERAGRKL
jgi:hypothetical protein